MKKFIKTASALCTALAFTGCSSDGEIVGGAGVGGVGSVEFKLDLPDPSEESVSEIELHILCTGGIDQTHILDVDAAEVVAAFGGLADAAECTVTLSSVTDTGRNCDGDADFIVVGGSKIDVDVTLICQGEQISSDGQVRVGANFEIQECANDRIKKLYAIPSNLLLGESTTVELETMNVVGTASYSYQLVTDATHTAGGTLSASVACAGTSQSCQDFLCESLGAAADTQENGVLYPAPLPHDDVYVEVTVEDDECFDKETIWIDCFQASVCGDNNEEGVEECDDGNTVSNDGCSETCAIEECGDGIVQTLEECDGTVGVGANQACDPVTCELTDLPYCGDLIQNGTEECDDDDGLANPLVQTCGAPGSAQACTIVADCGNGIEEGTEECDDGNADENDGCLSTCETAAIEDTGCVDCIDGPGDTSLGGYVASSCSASDTTGCREVLECYIDNDCYAIGYTPGFCYCGGSTSADLAACQAGTVAPFGPCADEIADAGSAGLTAAQVLGLFNGGGTAAQSFSTAGTIMSFTTQGGQACFGDCQP